MDERLQQAADLIESERSQIGHEIHDSLLPLIFAASASLARVIGESDTSSENTKRLEQVSQWLTDAMHAGRRLLTQVYPPELVGTLWTSAARDTLERLLSDDAIEIQWQLAADVDDVSAPTALAAYRIVVEAARNAANHGKATEIVIGSSTLDGKHRVTVRDNGGGFDPTQIPEGHFGIRSMIGRAELVGGELLIESSLGGPTCVTFLLDPSSR